MAVLENTCLAEQERKEGLHRSEDQFYLGDTPIRPHEKADVGLELEVCFYCATDSDARRITLLQQRDREYTILVPACSECSADIDYVDAQFHCDMCKALDRPCHLKNGLCRDCHAYVEEQYAAERQDMLRQQHYEDQQFRHENVGYSDALEF